MTRNFKAARRTVFDIALCAAWAAFGILALHAATARAADGNELFGFGAIQKSLGGAGAASPKDATWSVVNPATLVDLERRFDFSFEWLHVRVPAEPRGSFLLSNPLAGKMVFNADVAIPTFGVVWPLEHATLGMGVIGVEGDRTDFHHPRATLALFSDGDRRAADAIARIPLTIAHRFDNGWAVGAAVVPAIQRFRTDSLTLKLRPTRGNNRYDTAFGCGFELGVYRNWDKWAFGASYTTRTWMQDFPKYKSDLVLWSLDLPQQTQVGLAFRPIKPLEFVLDYKWIDWDDIPLLGRQTIDGGLGWKSQHIVKGGVSWDVNHRWTIRAGLSYGNPAVDNKHVFANMLTPAEARLHMALGFSHEFSDRSSVHVTYSQSLPENRTENGKGDLFSILGKGTKVGFEEYALTAEYSYKF